MEDVDEQTTKNIMNDEKAVNDEKENNTADSANIPQGNNKKQEENTVAEPNKSVEEITYPINDFIESAEALGYRKEVVSGALFNCEKTELTKEEFQTIVKNFLEKRVR
ncbi:hypothetical protein [Clostridium saccharoperbutylacetonicum]|uniref:hypothetical protein n=1 Tax=Clostridium saccharoperbutylacetonicum TaxID=36745 RepID=UPI000983D86C|nr:hypothetical protein [Clostridium saccharoperbutylacetonicum]AQR95565.1 hypothetical protein CLSAP_28810 [Clostridium saccharoperbutylacetonicum]NSB31425.1 hypothetical protein [Clostridium saccharoperbutylacetonicum]